MPAKRKIEIWDKFNRLTIIEILPSRIYWKKSYRMIKCKCDCWEIREMQLWALTTWHTKSCWCLCKEINLKRITKHWMSNTRLYWIWTCLKDRCNNPNNIRWENYGWRWITYPEKWETFEWFWEDVKDWYKDNLTIDRIDVNKSYSKENCRWATYEEQWYNRTDNIIYKGKCLAEWCKILNFDYNKIYWKIRYWKTIEQALFK